MAPIKFVIKCGNFAVLVDLHVLPQGPQASIDWFTAVQTEEVAALVRDSVDQRVKQYAEFLYDRRQPKQRKALPPALTFSVKGENFNLVANFLKRHSSLRCVVKRDLRLFPERYVVCVSCPEDALANHRNPSLAAAELMEQSRSEYFSSVGRTHEFLHSPTKTKKSALQKLAKQAGIQQMCSGVTMKEHMDQRACPKNQTSERKAGETEPSSKAVPKSELEAPACNSSSSNFMAEIQRLKPEDELGIICKSSKRCEPGDDGEDPHLQPAKRPCLGRPPGSAECSSQTSVHDLPLPLVQVKTESKASLTSERKETTLEVELLTSEIRAQKLPLTSNNTAPTIQNRPATSLRGLSVKPASSGSSIGSRSTLGEEGSENMPRTSRLRRTKRS